MQIVYVIASKDQTYKIGYSNNARRRLANLQSSSHHPLRLVAASEVDDGRKYERLLHAALDDYRASGEWFICPLDKILSACDDVGMTMSAVSDKTALVAPYEPSPITFRHWIDEMAKAPFFASERDCADMLGLTQNEFIVAKLNGTDLRTALACRALLHRMEPYGS